MGDAQQNEDREAFSSVQRIHVKIACTKCGKGFKIGTNEAKNIKIKIRVGGISKFSAFVCTPIWLRQTKAFH